MDGYYKARRDFGADFEDGELLMSPVGSCYLLHLDRDAGLGQIDKWSFVNQELTTIFRGGACGACSVWNRIRQIGFGPHLDHLKLANAPMSWWPHAKRR